MLSLKMGAAATIIFTVAIAYAEVSSVSIRSIRRERDRKNRQCFLRNNQARLHVRDPPWKLMMDIHVWFSVKDV
ncbi:hypothetical protein AU377_13140 [Sporosarcina sp. HYO08]|nr:hypothetical protein AU377_13140 [Sporosarcina sp. HYO08]